MPTQTVLKAYKQNSATPAFVLQHEDKQYVGIDPKQPSFDSADFDRFELYDNGQLTLVLNITRLKVQPFFAPCPALDPANPDLPKGRDPFALNCIYVEADTRNFLSSNPQSILKLTFRFEAQQGTHSPMLSLASLNDQPLALDKNGKRGLIEIGDFPERLASRDALPENGKAVSAIERCFGKKEQNGEEAAVKARKRMISREAGKPESKSQPDLKKRSDRETAWPVLEFERKYSLKEPLTLPFGVRLEAGKSMTVRQRLAVRWLNRVPNAEPWVIFADIDAAAVVKSWNGNFARPYLDSLARIKAGAPASLMPKFDETSAAGNPDWLLFARARETRSGGRINLQLIGPVLSPGEGSPSAILEFPNLRPHTGDNGLSMSGHIARDRGLNLDRLERSPNQQPYFSFSFTAEGPSQPNSNKLDDLNTVRLGAFDLQFGAAGKKSEPSTFTVLPREGSKQDQLSTIPDRVELLVNLPLIEVVPAGQDDLPASEFLPEGFSPSCPPDENYRKCSDDEDRLENNFRREPPLILTSNTSIPSPVDQQKGTRLWLNCMENTRRDISQTLRLSIRLHNDGSDTPPKPAESDALVLDRDPFLLAVVRFAPIRTLKPLDSDEVAWWSNASGEGAAWHVMSDPGPSQLILPPQAVGEAMLKEHEISDKDRLDFRLSPPALQKLESSYTPSQYSEVPWNLRRILGYAGQRDPGAGIVQLQYELLYGLACTVEPKEMLRMAELFSTVGRIQGMLPRLATQNDTYQFFRQSWADLYRRYKSRLAIFEVRRPGPNFGRALNVREKPALLTLSDGVSCTIRSNADLYYPNLSRKNGCSPTIQDDSEFKICENGLKGGATWAFESPRLYMATVRNPASDSAEITAPYFSSLGAWGFQKATFDNHRTTIYSNTAMGRLFSYSLERIGRIANYGNLAKHVIQYERTVDPSEQFVCEQNPLRRRPVVRKVREFVEILEKEREIRQDEQDPASGFVKKIIFNTTVFPVLSRWGTDVGNTGWKIPLFSPSANQNSPKMYPFPEIILQCAAGDGTSGAAGILEPEKLIFYTDTQKDGAADPHEWPLVPFLDYPPLPAPTPRKAFDSGRTSEELHSDPEYPPGYRMFTYAVEPLGKGVNLVDGRADRAISAVIRNITIVRTAVTPPLPPTLENSRQFTATIQERYQQVRSLLASGALEQARQKVDDLVTDFKNKADDTLNKNLKEVRGGLEAESNMLLAKAADREKELQTRFASQVDATLANINLEFAAEFSSAWEASQKLADPKARLQEIAHAEVSLLEERFKAIPAWGSGLRTALFEAWNTIQLFQKKYNDFINRLRKAICPPLGDSPCKNTPDLTEFKKVLTEAPVIEQQWLQLYAEVASKTASWMPNASALHSAILHPLETSFREALQAVKEQMASLKPDLASIQRAVNDIKDLANNFPLGTLPANLKTDYFQQKIDEVRELVRSQVEDAIKNAGTERDKFLNDIRNRLKPETLLPQGMAGKVQEIVGLVENQVKSAKDVFQTLQIPALATIDNLMKQDIKTFGQAELTNWLRNADTAAEHLFESAAGALQNQFKTVEQAADTPMRMLRALGKPPELPNLKFSLPDLGYYFRPNVPELDLTPVLTQVQQLGPALRGFGDSINALGTKLPSIKLLDRVLPPDLTKFDLSSIFPDFGGLKLDNLFSNLKMPKEVENKVRITHGADPTGRTAWVAADVDFHTDSSTTVFSFGPMTLMIPVARFQARVEMAASSQGVERKSRGSIQGDWQLQFGGAKLVTLRDTSLTFDNGGLHFNVSPEKVELDGVLNFISDMLSKVSDPANGFVAAPTPTGFEARLDIPVPDIQLGTFGMSNLSLRNSFALDLASEFNLSVGFSLASKQAPFSLTLFALGGGGFIETKARYYPATGKLSCEAHIGITASASLAISLGPIKGGVYIYLGVTVDFSAGGSQPRGLAIGAMLLIRGQVSILSIVSAYISVGLDLTYSSGELVGKGYFSISIKICWCFTLTVSQSISFKVGSGGGRSSLRHPVYLASLMSPDGTVSDVGGLILPEGDNTNPDVYISMAEEYVSMFAEDVA